AKLRSTEADLVLFEILREHIGCWLGDFARQRPAEQYIFDRALLVLVAIHGFDHGLGCVSPPSDGAGKLAAQHLTTLFGDEAGLGKSGGADGLLKPHMVKLAGWSAERRISRDLLADLGIRKREPKCAYTLIEHSVGNELPDDNAVEPRGTGLIG